MSTLCLRFCYAVGIALVASVSACRAEVEDSVPYTINFQSVLKERKAFGAYRPLSGVQQVQFRLWDAAEGGTLIWGREFPVYCNEEGAFNVMLTDNGTKLGGIAEYLREAFSSPACWLELTVVGLGEAILPRSPVASVAYALNVQQAATVDAADEGIFTVNGQVLLQDTNGVTQAILGRDASTQKTVALASRPPQGGAQTDWPSLNAHADGVSFSGCASFFPEVPGSPPKVHLLSSSVEQQPYGYENPYVNHFLLLYNHGDLDVTIDQWQNGSVDLLMNLKGESTGAVLVPIPATSANKMLIVAKDCDYGFYMFNLGGNQESAQ